VLNGRRFRQEFKRSAEAGLLAVLLTCETAPLTKWLEGTPQAEGCPHLRNSWASGGLIRRLAERHGLSHEGSTLSLLLSQNGDNCCPWVKRSSIKPEYFALTMTTWEWKKRLAAGEKKIGFLGQTCKKTL
jgi:hypothetical protein